MDIIEVKNLAIPEIKVIRFKRYPDERGYFSEVFRKSDLFGHPQLQDLKEFVQANESWSKAGVVKGLHFQWDPPLGKLIRTSVGRMIDMVLDVRLNSPTFGKIILYAMPANPEADFSEWIWLPPGFAHGNIFTQDSLIQYYCTGEYNPAAEAGINPFAKDIDWSLADAGLKKEFDATVTAAIISEKDKKGFSLAEWQADERAKNFIYS